MERRRNNNKHVQQNHHYHNEEIEHNRSREEFGQEINFDRHRNREEFSGNFKQEGNQLNSEEI